MSLPPSQLADWAPPFFSHEITRVQHPPPCSTHPIPRRDASISTGLHYRYYFSFFRVKRIVLFMYYVIDSNWLVWLSLKTSKSNQWSLFVVIMFAKRHRLLNQVERRSRKSVFKYADWKQPVIIKNKINVRVVRSEMNIQHRAHLSIRRDFLNEYFLLPRVPSAEGRLIEEEIVNDSLARKLEVLRQL